MDRAISDYFAAWNVPAAPARMKLLEHALADDVEFVEPNGHWRGRDQVSQRITWMHDQLPGTTIAIATVVDSHNNVHRYGWELIDGGGTVLMEGIDVVEMAADGRIRRVLMFHGTLANVSAS